VIVIALPERFFVGIKTKNPNFRFNLIMKSKFKLRGLRMAFALSATVVTAHAQLGKPEIVKDSTFKDEVKTIVYELPYLPGKKVSIVQGYNGWWSHQKSNALDFLMRKGQIICAARGGVVQSCRSDSKKGGPSYKYISDGNYVIIKHDDSTSAAYWHLEFGGVLVKAGDTVVAGQPIGKVGTTGFSSGPHLHFEVYYFDKNGNEHTVKTVFRTTRGIKKPRTWHFYKRPGVLNKK
jgi:murein DD-endopeptidase MepM/ murein hydrolase activator NlpD